MLTSGWWWWWCRHALSSFTLRASFCSCGGTMCVCAHVCVTIDQSHQTWRAEWYSPKDSSRSNPFGIGLRV